MIYLEFIERDQAMPIGIFRQLGNQASTWAEGAEDRMTPISWSSPAMW